MIRNYAMLKANDKERERFSQNAHSLRISHKQDAEMQKGSQTLCLCLKWADIAGPLHF